jgi:hypothetical protein
MSAIDAAAPRAHLERIADEHRSGFGLLREVPAMRTLVFSLALLALIAIGVCADTPPAKKAAPSDKGDVPLEVGKDLPGAFHPYNVTGPHKQRFHCLISEHDLDPMVMIFHKNVDFGDPLPNLLKKLDVAINKNPSARLGAFVVFLPDDLMEVVGRDDKGDDARGVLEKKVADKAADWKLRHVILCLDSRADVEKYHLSDANVVTVVLYNKLKIVAVFALPQSEFNDAVEKILATVAEKFGATKK